MSHENDKAIGIIAGLAVLLLSAVGFATLLAPTHTAAPARAALSGGR